MAQFVIGFAAGVYIGTHYNCRPGLSLASDTLEKYCPKRDPESNYVPIKGKDYMEDDKKEEDKKKEDKKPLEKSIEMSAFKKWF